MNMRASTLFSKNILPKVRKIREKLCRYISMFYMHAEISPNNDDIFGRYKNDKKMSCEKLLLGYLNLSFCGGKIKSYF